MSHPSTIEVPMGIGQQGVSEEILLRAAVARADHMCGRGTYSGEMTGIM